MSASLVTFSLAGRSYGIEVDAVREVLRELPRTRIPLAPPELAGLINVRGQVLTAIDLRARFGLPDRDDGSEPMLMVVRGPEEPVALLVDSIGAVIDVEDAWFEAPPATLTGDARDLIRGAYKLPDRLLHALDVNRAVAA